MTLCEEGPQADIFFNKLHSLTNKTIHSDIYIFCPFSVLDLNSLAMFFFC